MEVHVTWLWGVLITVPPGLVSTPLGLVSTDQEHAGVKQSLWSPMGIEDLADSRACPGDAQLHKSTSLARMSRWRKKGVAAGPPSHSSSECAIELAGLIKVYEPTPRWMRLMAHTHIRETVRAFHRSATRSTAALLARPARP